MSLPLIYMGDGEFRASSSYHVRRCEEQFGLGELITVEAQNERSRASHAHYFAVLDELWQTLPESLGDDFPSSEALRKWCLIKAGYSTQTKLVFKDNEAAIEAEMLIADLDNYAVCEVTDNILAVWRAKSQSLKAMGKEEFQKSKDAVLTEVRKLLDSHENRAL